MANVSTSAQLRTAIQNASSLDPTINVASGSYSSVTTLAKLPSYRPEPAVAYNGYSIIGTAPRASTVINDTRIYQQNIDGSYAPSTVKDLTLQYNSASTNNTAILRANTGSYTLDNLAITGQHAGWAGNGGVYMSLTVSDGTNPINASLTLSNSSVSVTGQNGNAAFLQSWNNTGMVKLDNNQFNETGLNAGSFHFATMYPGGDTTAGPLGMYDVSNNTFTSSGTNKTRGNRLETVEAMIYGNTFNNGAFLDLYGDVTGVSIDDNMGSSAGNAFNTLYGGCGIKFNRTSSSGATLTTIDVDTGSTIMVTGNSFTGYGMAIVNNNTSTAQLVTLIGTNTVTTGTLSLQTFDKMVAGGSTNNTITSGGSGRDWINAGAGNDTISAGGGNDYIIGGSGNDSISSGAGMDTIIYYETNEGQDIFTDFVSGTDCLAFRGNTSGGSTFFNFAPGTSLTSGSNFITSGTPPTTGPTFIFIGNVLSYDADGSGGGAAVNIATFNGTSTAIAATDIKFF
jgi:Ca2+-binding RTX toxin-like protein